MKTKPFATKGQMTAQLSKGLSENTHQLQDGLDLMEKKIDFLRKDNKQRVGESYA